MSTYKKAGVGQRIPLSELEYEAMMTFFACRCAFCGEKDTSKLIVTRLVMPRWGGGDELNNIIPSCRYCSKSRGSKVMWQDWLKFEPEIFSPKRVARLEEWIDRKPNPIGQVYETAAK